MLCLMSCNNVFVLYPVKMSEMDRHITVVPVNSKAVSWKKHAEECTKKYIYIES